LTLYETDIKKWFIKAGFIKIDIGISWLRHMSIKNWLNSSGLDDSTKNIIYNMHVNSSDNFKKDYNLVTEDNDCFIDMRQVIVVGIK
jgi:hypothetical protein